MRTVPISIVDMVETRNGHGRGKEFRINFVIEEIEY